MENNTVKYLNKVYAIIKNSLLFWYKIFTRGVVQTATEFHATEFDKKTYDQTKYNILISIIWLVLFIYTILSRLFIIEDNFGTINLFLIIINLVFLFITIFVSWLSYIIINFRGATELESIVLAFQSSVKFWQASFSFLLFITIATIISRYNTLFVICFIPGIYFQLNKYIMQLYKPKIEETYYFLKQQAKEKS